MINSVVVIVITKLRRESERQAFLWQGRRKSEKTQQQSSRFNIQWSEFLTDQEGSRETKLFERSR